jgi:GT2 family glycosyltransferase
VALSGLKLPFAVTLLSFEENQGVSTARNACASKARSTLLYFSDDDVLLEPDTLLKHIQFHKNRKLCVALGWVDWEYQGQIEPMHPNRVGYWNLHGINTSMPKDIFDEVGGFPEWITSYGHEDIVLGYLLFKKGYSINVLSESTVQHLGPNPMRGLQLDKAMLAGRNAVRVVQRYPELAFRLGVHPVSLVLKGLLLYKPLGYVWKVFNQGSYNYEYTYLQGALEERRNV